MCHLTGACRSDGGILSLTEAPVLGLTLVEDKDISPQSSIRALVGEAHARKGKNQTLWSWGPDPLRRHHLG